MSDVRRRAKLTLDKETLRVLDDFDLKAAVGGDFRTTIAPHTVDTAVHAVCGVYWVSTSPPTHLCQ